MKTVAKWLVPTCFALGVLLLNGARIKAADGVPAPKGAALLLTLAGDGVQIYTCEAKDGGYVWNFKGPEAALFDAQGRQMGTHFAGPTWQLADGSSLAGETVAKADSPEGSIPWLLLRGTTHVGSGALSSAAYVRRVDTKGGVAPKAGCDAGHVGDQARMRYTASYQYFSAPK